MSVIDKISKLVLADPNVTARQIAKTLGYAEEKSVYYWLSKSGYKGMKDFKKSVLGRSLPPSRRAGMPVLARDAPEAFLPLYADAGQTALGRDLGDHLLEYLGDQGYGVLLTREDWEPIAGAGDVLLVDPEAPCFQGDIHWASVRGQMRLVRQYGLEGDTQIYVDAVMPGSVVSPDYVCGKVVFIVKKRN